MISPDHLGPLPPYVQMLDFLPSADCRRLLEWAIANRALFAPASVTAAREGSGGRVDPQQRVALVAKVRGDIRETLLAHFQQALPAVMKATGTNGAAPDTIELQIAAHPDGAHFIPHLDIPIGANRVPLGGGDRHDRVISAVYYFHAEPQAFTGGELRLYRYGAPAETVGKEPGNYVDIAPINNSLVAFPSWTLHEVRPVQCASDRFRDYRFAVNCWYCKVLGPSQER